MHLQKCLTFGVHIIFRSLFFYCATTPFFNPLTVQLLCTAFSLQSSSENQRLTVKLSFFSLTQPTRHSQSGVTPRLAFSSEPGTFVHKEHQSANKPITNHDSLRLVLATALYPHYTGISNPEHKFFGKNICNFFASLTQQGI